MRRESRTYQELLLRALFVSCCFQKEIGIMASDNALKRRMGERRHRARTLCGGPGLRKEVCLRLGEHAHRALTSLGFALKSLQRNGLLDQIGRQELERKVTVELEIFGLVHHTHPAAAELAQDAIVRDGLVDD
jgi:hypothetical protein